MNLDQKVESVFFVWVERLKAKWNFRTSFVEKWWTLKHIFLNIHFTTVQSCTVLLLRYLRTSALAIRTSPHRQGYSRLH